MGEERATHEGPHTEGGAPGAGAGEPRHDEPSESHRYQEQAKEAARETAREAGATMQEYGRQLREQGYELARQQQHELASWLSRIGDAFGQSAEQLRRSNDVTVAACLESTGDRAEGAASYLREHEPREVMDDATHFARRHPGWVIGGALVTGFVVSRFIKAAWQTESGQEPGARQKWASEQHAEPSGQAGAPSGAEPAEPYPGATGPRTQP